MRKNAVRMVAVALAVGATVATSGTLASAAAAPAQPFSAESITVDPQAAAKGLQQLHDELKSAAHRGDVATTTDKVADVRAVLGQVQQRATTWKVQSSTVDTVSQAKRQSAELATRLDALPATQSDQVPLPVPAVPEPLASVSALLQGLLVNLQGVVNGLLPIGLPPGVPVPVVPSS